MIKLKKGAMFGLDARIALAIFGALSVISGAALYSAIKQARVIAFVTEMNEFAKAREQYLLNTGQELPVVGTRNLKTAELVASSVAGWKGPYWSHKNNTIDPNYLKHPLYNLEMFVIAQETPVWNVPTDTTPICDGSNPCYVWVHITGVNKPFNQDIDMYIDGSIDGQSGNYRWRDDATYLKVGMKLE